MIPEINFKSLFSKKSKSGPLTNPPPLEFDEDDTTDEVVTAHSGARAHWLLKKQQQNKRGEDFKDPYEDEREIEREIEIERERKRKRKPIDPLAESLRNRDNGLKPKLWNDYIEEKLPSISENPNETREAIFYIARVNIQDKPWIREPNKEAIKNIQTSYYILTHEDEEAKRFARRYLLETLLTPGFLLKDDYSIDESRLAIVTQQQENFTSFLLSNSVSGIGFPIFDKFLRNKIFSPDENSNEEIKQKLLKSMIFLIPTTLNYNKAFKGFELALTLIPEADQENFTIDVLKYFALSQSTRNNNFYIDKIALAIENNISKDNRSDAIYKIFSHPNEHENSIKSAHLAGNNNYIHKIKELIEKTFAGNSSSKKEFITKLSENCGVDLGSYFQNPHEISVSKPKMAWSSRHPLDRTSETSVIDKSTGSSRHPLDRI